jgi:hypothetical protein
LDRRSSRFVNGFLEHVKLRFNPMATHSLVGTSEWYTVTSLDLERVTLSEGYSALLAQPSLQNLISLSGMEAGEIARLEIPGGSKLQKLTIICSSREPSWIPVWRANMLLS